MSICNLKDIKLEKKEKNMPIIQIEAVRPTQEQKEKLIYKENLRKNQLLHTSSLF